MKALRLHGVGDLRLVDVAEPHVPPGHDLIRVTAVGICGSDLHWFSHGGIGDATLDEPLVIGHEMAGVIESGPAAGTRVAIDPAIPCRRCPVCATGDTNLCPNVLFAGHARLDGGLQERMAWPSEGLHPLPSSIDDVEGAMLEPLGVAIHAFDLAHFKLGMHVLVVGAGPIGLLLVQLARLAGAGAVVAVEPLAHRREAALRLGADRAAIGLDDLAPIVEDVTGGRGFDLALEASNSGVAVEIALAAVRPGARVVLGGIPDGDRTSFQASVARRKGLTLTLVRRMKEVYPRAIELVASGRIDVAALVTDRFPLEQAGTAFRIAAARNGLKVVVQPTPSSV